MADDKGEPAPMDVEEGPASAAEPVASAPETTGPRKRKQVEFFAPADVKKPEKLVIKEVSIVARLEVGQPVTHHPTSRSAWSAHLEQVAYWMTLSQDYKVAYIPNVCFTRASSEKLQD